MIKAKYKIVVTLMDSTFKTAINFNRAEILSCYILFIKMF